MKKKLIISSLSAIVACASVVAGATYALFTSESKVNVAVTSGTVEVVATAKNFVVKSGQWNDTTSSYDIVPTGSEYFTNGGRVDFTDGNSIKIERMSAMDYVTFDLVVENNSDIRVQYRTSLEATFTKGSISDLECSTSIDGVTKHFTTNTSVSKWNILEVGSDPETVTVTVGLPESSNAQGMECEFVYTVEAIQANAHVTDWDGKTADTSWYNEDATTFTLSHPNQIAGLSDLIDGGETFEGKTIILDEDISLEAYDENNNLICFDPIGSYRNKDEFKGTFDGKGHTISGLYQNTWALNNGYYYGDLGIGFFGAVRDAEIKNVNFDGVEISGENGLCGVVAATAYGECKFENITVSNAKCNDYQYYAGGVVGWASGSTEFVGCVIDESTIIGSQWGDFGNSTGGIVGGCGSTTEIFMKDCVVACRIDAVNDIVSAYQWYCYRNCGMLIGNTGNTVDTDPNGAAVGNATAPYLTCENVKVIYNDWANYTYCEFAGTGYPYVRVQAGVSVDAYTNVRYGHPTDANGNVVVDDNHVHNEGEDHHLLLRFDQLYGGRADHRYCYYGVATHDGVTVVYNNK